MSKVEKLISEIKKEKENFYRYKSKMSGEQNEHAVRNYYEAALLRIRKMVNELPSVIQYEHLTITNAYRRGEISISELTDFEKKYPLHDPVKLSQFLSDLANLNL